MSLQRITRIQVLVAGLVVIAAVAIVFLIAFIRPQSKAIADKIAIAEEDEKYAATRSKRETDLATAIEREERVTADWDEIVETRMPKLDFSDPIVALMRMWDLPAEEEALIRKWFNSSGAVVSGYSFQTWPTAMPSSFPAPDMKTLPPLNWNLSVQVKGFPALLEWLRKFTEAPRFMVMDSVTIQGSHGPDAPLIASIPVTLWQWTGVEPMGGAPAAAAAGAGVTRGRGQATAGSGMLARARSSPMSSPDARMRMQRGGAGRGGPGGM